MPIRPPFQPQSVVFDLDGLLVDSEGRWGEAEQEVVESFDRPWDPAVRTLLLGKGPQDAALALAEHIGDVDPAEVDRRLLAAALAAFDRGIPLRPGAQALVAGLHGRVPLAVATNSRRVLAERALAACRLEGFLDAVVCVDDVDHPKPAADPYARACALLGAPPSASIAFEDSPVGMRSARAAGLWVIGCPSFPGEAVGAADAFVSSLVEVDVAVLLGG